MNILIAFVAVVAGSAMLLLVSRASRLSVMWGALWGASLGFWVLAPLILRVHYLRPLMLSHWAILDAGLLVVFGLLGAALSFVACAPVSLWQVVTRRPMRRPDLACACLVAGLLPAAYLGFSAWIEWRNFSRAPAMANYLSTLAPAAALSLGGLALVVGYGRVTRQRPAGESGRPTDGGLRAATAILVLLGALVLPQRAGASRPPTSQVEAIADSPSSVARSKPAAPLLIIGLDGGNWPTLQPLLDKGLLPTLARLIADGMHGEVHALWPPYWSAPAWGAILTGHSRDEIGIHEDLSATVSGLPPFELPLTLDPALDPVFYVEFVMTQFGVIRPAPPPRGMLQRPPIWELLSKAGVRTAVIRFPFTFPAAGQSDLVVSDRIVTDLWETMGVVVGDRQNLVTPPAEAERIFSWLSEADGSADAAFREVCPRGHPQPARDTSVQPLQVLRELLGMDDITNVVLGIVRDPVQVLREVLGFDQRALYATAQVIRARRDMDVVMVYIGGFDLVCHAFWQYRFPDAFPESRPTPADVERLGPVIDRYLQFLDGRISQLASTFQTPPNIIVVSDHGEQAAPAFPLWKGVHSARGVFIAAGPDVPRIERALEVSYYDVAPTVLDLEGVETPRSMSGVSVRAPARAVTPVVGR